LLGEAVEAARGVLAVIVGNRESARHFNLTGHGLAGSFIALLIATGIGVAIPLLLGLPGRVLLSFGAAVISFVLQVGCGTIALWQAKRLDGFVPYLVVDNWASFYVILAGLALNLIGVPDDFIGFPIGVLIVIVAVNIGRVIVGLQPLQVAMFVIAQVVGYLVSGLLISLLLALLGFTVSS
jgi:hypothetical protein